MLSKFPCRDCGFMGQNGDSYPYCVQCTPFVVLEAQKQWREFVKYTIEEYTRMVGVKQVEKELSERGGPIPKGVDKLIESMHEKYILMVETYRPVPKLLIPKENIGIDLV